MKIIRWITFLPISVFLAISFGFWWSSVFSRATYSYRSIWASVVGLGPLFLGRVLPVFLFVALAAVIAPRVNRFGVGFLGLLGGVYGFPLGLTFYPEYGNSVFWGTQVCGAIIGSAFGMLFAFRLSRARAEKRSNKSPETRTTSGPVSA